MLLLTGPVACQLAAQSLVCLERKQDFQAISQGHGLNGQYITQSCPVNPAIFIQSKDCASRLLHYPDAVHEALHVLNSSNQDFNFTKPRSRCYYSKPGTFLSARLVEHLPPTVVIAKDVPGWMTIVGSRFRTYVVDTVQDASKNGLFGMVEEFSAYRTTMESYNDLMVYGTQQQAAWIDGCFPELYARGNDAVLAYYEFHLFQLLYMDRLRVADSTKYTMLVESGIVQALQHFDTTFAAAIEQWNALTAEYIAHHPDIQRDGEYLKGTDGTAWSTREEDLNRVKTTLRQAVNCKSFYRPLLL